MPQFDVYRTAQGELLLDCQSDALGHLTTRLATPLMPPNRAPERRPQMNPVFEINGQPYVMVTQFAAAVRIRELRDRFANLETHRLEIIGAIDMLLTGV